MSVTPATWAPVDAWPPRTEAALVAAARDGHLHENHTLELKRELAPGDPANKELAADLASLANDGGLLFIGVDETTGPGLHPVPLAGLAERIEQVARTRVDEPLPLTFVQIESSSQAGDGYLVIRVPASPRAPHMAGGRYWGRGDKTKHHLSNADVERLMALRARWAVNAEQALRDWTAKDPIVGAEQQHAHLFVVADPVPPRERLLLPVFTGDWNATFRRLVSATSHHGDAFTPDIPDGLSNFSPTPDGWAAYSYYVFGHREEGLQAKANHEGHAIKLEICENGQLRLMCGRAAESQKLEFEPKRLLLIDALCLGLTARMVSLAQRVSAEAGFLGSWDFAVGMTGMRGATSLARYQATHWGGGPAYSEDTYVNTTRAALAEIEAGTGPVVERLLGRLIRAVGADQLAPVTKHFQPV
jgi:hypothetical protein